MPLLYNLSFNFSKLKNTNDDGSLRAWYKQKQCWGLLASIDLYDCAPELIRSPKKIEEFIIKLCAKIKMQRYGPAMIKRFGEGELEGYSALQFIETSSITMHFDEGKERAFIEIFSCKFFEPKQAEEFCRRWLKAKRTKLKHFLRY